MGLTITEKIIARHAGKESVVPGETVWVSVDLVMTHDVCGPPSFAIMEREFGSDAPVFDKEKVVLIPDHFIFTKDPASIRNVEHVQTCAIGGADIATIPFAVLSKLITNPLTKDGLEKFRQDAAKTAALGK